MADDELFELGDSAKPWNRQSARDAAGVVRWESGKAWLAFKAYANLGDLRSLRAVSKQLGKSRNLIERWSKRWRWPERTKAYDDRMHEAELAGQIRARKDMSARQARVAVLGENVATQALIDLQQRLQNRPGRRPLTPHEAVRLFEACAKIERIARGGEPDGDEVAAIHIHVSVQDKPRYAEVLESESPVQVEEELYDA